MSEKSVEEILLAELEAMTPEELYAYVNRHAREIVVSMVGKIAEMTTRYLESLPPPETVQDIHRLLIAAVADAASSPVPELEAVDDEMLRSMLAVVESLLMFRRQFSAALMIVAGDDPGENLGPGVDSA